MLEEEQISNELKKFDCILSYADLINGQVIEEPFAKHALLSIKYWSYLKDRVLNALSRVLDKPIEDVRSSVSLAILLHDVGKLTTAYQRYLNEKKMGAKIMIGFDHEVASIPVLLTYMKQMNMDDYLSQIVAGAVLFHHEALRQHEQRKKVNQLTGPIYNKYPDGIIRFNSLASELIRQLLLMKFGNDLLLKLDFSIEDLKAELIDLFYIYDPDNPIDLHRIRLRVSAVQQILSVCDNRAAWEARPKRDQPSIFIKELLEGGWKYGNRYS